MVVEGSTIREVFEAYVERVLSLALRGGQVLVMSNFTGLKDQEQLEVGHGPDAWGFFEHCGYCFLPGRQL